MVFPVVMYGCEGWTIKKAELKNWCFWSVVLEKTLESPLNCKEIQPANPKGNQSPNIHRKDWAEAEAAILWPPDAKNWLLGKRLWWWERLRAGGGGDNREWDSWMTLTTQWTWVWVSSRSWWWTGKPGMLQSMGSQRVVHDWMTELKWKNFKFMLIGLSSLNSSGYTLSLSNSSLVNTPHRLSSCNHIQLHIQTSIISLLYFHICWSMTSFGYPLFKMLCWLITYRPGNNIIAHFTVSAQTI